MTISYQNQPARQKNIEAIVSFFKSGIKPKENGGKLGVEIEYFIVGKNGEPISYSQENGVAWLLGKLSETYRKKAYGKNGELIGVSKPGQSITLEPGAQLELSAGPFDEAKSVCNVFSEFETNVGNILGNVNEKLVSLGYRPASRANDIELIPKRRYDLMDEYFSRIGAYGRRMMRCSAATQISIDYFSEADCLRKLRIASAIAPLLALICDNAPVFEGTRRSHRVMRGDVWLYCDTDRCGTVPNVLKKDFSLEAYANYILDTPAILIPDNDDFRAAPETFGEAYANIPMTREDIEHAVSMFFTDARLKTYIEIRPADSMPSTYAAAYAALIKGLFYSDKSLDDLDSMTANIEQEDVDKAKRSISGFGYGAIVYGKPVSEQVNRLFEIAESALGESCRNVMLPLKNMASEQKTLADGPMQQF